MTKIITYEEALGALTKAVEDRGADFIYREHYHPGQGLDTAPTCKYVVGDEPACIVGVVLDSLGVKRSTLIRLDQGEGLGAGYSFSTAPVQELLLYNDDIRLNQDAQVLLGAAQREQDLGETWGDALVDSQAYVARRKEDGAL